MIIAASLAAFAAQAAQPGRSPAVTGPAIMADVPNSSSIFKEQAAQVIGSNSINDQLTVKNNANPAVNRETPTPKREPAVAPPSSGNGMTSMDVR